MPKSLFHLIRGHQWIKNILVFIPLFFSHRFSDPVSIRLALFAFVAFIIASSAVYILNDLLDAEMDKLHPHKKGRPIASGDVSKGSALVLYLVFFLLSIGFSLWVDAELLGVIVFYMLLNLAYSFVLKHLLFVDVLTVAIGFVLRVIAGAVVLDVRVSEWMVVLIFLLALFAVVSKRRQEVKLLAKKSVRTRRVLSAYTVALLDQINGVIVPVILVSYILYTFQARIHSPFMLATIPLVIYAFLRFLYLIHSSDFGASSSDYKKDVSLVLVGIFWAGLVFMALLGY